MPRAVTLGPNLIALVAAAGTAKVLRGLTNLADPALSMAVASLHQHVAGGTNYADGLKLALDLLESRPESYGRHIYLIADGVDNVGREQLDEQVQRAIRLRTRVYCVPIGCVQQGHSFDLERLYQIAHRTGGNLKPMRKMKELAEHFERLAARGGRNLGRSVAKLLIADVSPSMQEAWDRTAKLDALKFALLRFLQVEGKKQ